MNRIKFASPALVVIVLAILLAPVVGSSRALLSLSVTMGIYAIMAISLGLAWGQAGLLSISQAALASLGAYASAIASLRWGVPIYVGLVLAIVVAGAAAYGLARPIVRLSHLSLALATLIFSITVEYSLSAGGAFTGGYIGLSGIPSLPGSGTLWIHAFIWLLVALAVFGYDRITRSTQGRALRVIGHDRLLARSLGIHTTARLSATFGLCGALAGLAGWLYAHTATYMSPHSLPVTLSLTLVIMVLVGGKRYVLGPVVGAVLITLLIEYLPGTETHGMIYGSVLVLTIIFLPKGILNLLSTFLTKDQAEVKNNDSPGSGAPPFAQTERGT